MKLRQGISSEEIFCSIRKKWVHHGPEEFVRQSILEYLVESLKVPARLIAVEQSLGVVEAGNRKLADIVCWIPQKNSQTLQPWLLVECKAPTVTLNEKAVQQTSGYLSKIPSLFVWLSNGEENVYLALRESGQYDRVSSIPLFPSS